jgi:hypothetical protein
MTEFSPAGLLIRPAFFLFILYYKRIRRMSRPSANFTDAGSLI